MIPTEYVIETNNLRKELQRILRIPIKAVAVAENPELVSITNRVFHNIKCILITNLPIFYKVNAIQIYKES